MYAAIARSTGIQHHFIYGEECSDLMIWGGASVLARDKAEAAPLSRFLGGYPFPLIVRKF
jgi:hypothetical protein